jgi:trigger factor
MEATVETLEGNKVKVSVSVGEDEFEKAVDDAFRRIAREVRVPGFRPGKAPRKVLEARIGPAVAREEALREALPEYYSQAIRDNEVDVIAPPEIDITTGQEDGPLAFDAVVEIRPQITVGGYDSLRVTIPSPEPTDDEIQAQIDRLREPQAELETVSRPAIDGDHVLIDITGSQDGEELDGLTADDYVYEVGTEAIVPEIDDNLRGAKAGDILQFEAGHPDPDEEPLSFRILVKEVQQKVLPEVTDDWASEASEFATVDELRADLEKSIRTIKASQAQVLLRERTAEALTELVDDDPPEAMVSAEMQNRVQDLAVRLGAQGVNFEQWLAATGQDSDQLSQQLREAAEPAVRADLALRAVAEAESLEATDAELDDEIESLATRIERDPDEVRKELEEGGQIPAVRSDLRKKKALDWLIERVEVVDEDGNPIDPESLAAPDEPDEDAEGPDDEAEVAGSDEDDESGPDPDTEETEGDSE